MTTFPRELIEQSRARRKRDQEWRQDLVAQSRAWRKAAERELHAVRQTAVARDVARD